MNTEPLPVAAIPDPFHASPPPSPEAERDGPKGSFTYPDGEDTWPTYWCEGCEEPIMYGSQPCPSCGSDEEIIETPVVPRSRALTAERERDISRSAWESAVNSLHETQRKLSDLRTANRDYTRQRDEMAERLSDAQRKLDEAEERAEGLRRQRNYWRDAVNVVWQHRAEQAEHDRDEARRERDEARVKGGEFLEARDKAQAEAEEWRAGVERVKAETADMEDPDRYHMLCVKLASLRSALSPDPEEASE